MAFEFIAHTPRKVYKNTFLQNVFISVRFDKINRNSIPNDFYEKWDKYIRTTFNNLEPQSDFFDNPVSISREDGVFTIFLSNGLVGAVIGAKDYRSFVDNVLPQLYKLRTFLKDVLNSPKINCLSVRKVNIWQFNSNDKITINQEKLRKSIFSSLFLNKKANGKLDEDEKRIPFMHKYNWVDDDTKNQVIVRTIFLPRRHDGAFAQILDTEALFCEKDITLEQLEGKSIELNDILYDLYHWCVNTRILDIMEDNNKNK